MLMLCATYIKHPLSGKGGLGVWRFGIQPTEKDILMVQLIWCPSH